MTDTPDKEWIERARAFIVSNGKSYDPTMTSQEFADHLAFLLARELQSSFDQGVERERERCVEIVDGYIGCDEIAAAIRTPTPTEGERGC